MEAPGEGSRVFPIAGACPLRPAKVVVGCSQGRKRGSHADTYTVRTTLHASQVGPVVLLRRRQQHVYVCVHMSTHLE